MVYRLALVAHDNMKDDIVDWAVSNRKLLSEYDLIGTGATGRVVAEATDLDVELLASGPLGGDQQVGAKISEQERRLPDHAEYVHRQPPSLGSQV